MRPSDTRAEQSHLSIFEEDLPMYYNRDEFLLLGRTGRVPPAARPGLPPRARVARVVGRAPFRLRVMSAAVPSFDTRGALTD